MDVTLVSSKGQVTIPKEVRDKLGIRQGSRVAFELVGDHVELRVQQAADLPASGFGMLKSRRTAIAADFDPATLLDKP